MLGAGKSSSASLCKVSSGDSCSQRIGLILAALRNCCLFVGIRNKIREELRAEALAAFCPSSDFYPGTH